MSEAQLGYSPLSMPLHLTRDSDFFCVIMSDDGDWPADAVVTIEVAGQTWTATVNGPDLTFDEDKVQVNAALDANADEYRLKYAQSSMDLVWSHGVVKKHD